MHEHHRATRAALAVAQDTVVGPPTRIRWLDGPTRPRSKYQHPQGVITANGRLFHIYDEAGRYLADPARHYLTARDAYTNETILFNDYDTVVLDIGNRVEDDLYHQIKGKVAEVYRSGDCVAPRGIDMAIIEGRKVGELL